MEGVTLDLIHEGEVVTCVSVGHAVPSLQMAAHDSELYTVLVVHRVYSVPHAKFKGAHSILRSLPKIWGLRTIEES